MNKEEKKEQIEKTREKKKELKWNQEEAANTIMYIVQDMLDSISFGKSIKLIKFEKEVLKIIKEI